MEHIKHWLDIASVGTAIGTIIGWFPHVAAGLSIIWTGLRIYETRTVQRWLGRRP